MKQETKLPLYKQLNEQRIKGSWRAADFCIMQNDDQIADFSGTRLDEFDEALNAEYAALAVNELANLAEALTKMCEWHEKQATWDKGDNGYYEAKQALSRIS